MSLLKVNEVQNYNGSSLTLTASTVSTSAQLNTGGNISVTGSINVSDDSTTRSNLGLGSIATQDSSNVTITGGTISNATTASTVNIKASINASGDAPIYACRAWVNFDGTLTFSPNPGTNAINAHGNISSIEDLGSGKFGVNFDVDMPHSNYAVAHSIEDGTGFNDLRVMNQDDGAGGQVRSVSKYEFYIWDGTGLNDPEVMSLMFFA